MRSKIVEARHRLPVDRPSRTFVRAISTRTVAEKLGGENVELAGLVDRLDRVAGKEVVGPRDQVVQIGHHHGHHVRLHPHARDQMRIERVLAPRLDLIVRARSRSFFSSVVSPLEVRSSINRSMVRPLPCSTKGLTFQTRSAGSGEPDSAGGSVGSNR